MASKYENPNWVSQMSAAGKLLKDGDIARLIAQDVIRESKTSGVSPEAIRDILTTDVDYTWTKRAVFLIQNGRKKILMRIDSLPAIRRGAIEAFNSYLSRSVSGPQLNGKKLPQG